MTILSNGIVKTLQTISIHTITTTTIIVVATVTPLTWFVVLRITIVTINAGVTLITGGTLRAFLFCVNDNNITIATTMIIPYLQNSHHQSTQLYTCTLHSPARI